MSLVDFVTDCYQKREAVIVTAVRRELKTLWDDLYIKTKHVFVKRPLDGLEDICPMTEKGRLWVTIRFDEHGGRTVLPSVTLVDEWELVQKTFRIDALVSPFLLESKKLLYRVVIGSDRKICLVCKDYTDLIADDGLRLAELEFQVGGKQVYVGNHTILDYILDDHNLFDKLARANGYRPDAECATDEVLERFENEIVRLSSELKRLYTVRSRELGADPFPSWEIKP